ncbi:MAG: hypothetical protein IV092_19575, partial [Burkholderiaceae bacterium]|nr:hypothetical protein [Burkholderiaceae bacterium]
MELKNLHGQRPEAGSPGTSGRHAAIGIGEEEHVADDAGQAVQIFEIRTHSLAQFFGAAWLAQCQFATADQHGQRRVQLMGHIGIECLHLLVGHAEAIQQRVELPYQRLQLVGLPGSVEASFQVRRRH